MSPKIFLAVAVLLTMAGLLIVDQRDARAGEVTAASGYKVLEPIRHGNLTVFPVVAAKNYETFADAILKKLIIEIAANNP